jgi:hypothetical protein
MAPIMGITGHHYLRKYIQFGQTTKLTVRVVARETVITTTLDVEGNQVETIRQIASVKYCTLTSLGSDETFLAVQLNQS